MLLVSISSDLITKCVAPGRCNINVNFFIIMDEWLKEVLYVYSEVLQRYVQV
jgi:hypothetical protein